MVGFTPPRYHQYGDSWDDQLETVDVFDLLCLDPFEHYDKKTILNRVKRISLAIHPDKLGTWQPPASINQQSLNTVWGWLCNGDKSKGIDDKRLHDMFKRGKSGWKSSWNYLQPAEKRNTPISSYLQRFAILIKDDTEETPRQSGFSQSTSSERLPIYPALEEQSKLLNLAQGSCAVAVAVVRGIDDTAFEEPRRVVVASLGLTGRMSFHVQSFDLEGKDVPSKSSDEGRVILTTFQWVVSNGRLLGRFKDNSRKQIWWFLNYMKSHDGRAPPRLAPPDETIEVTRQIPTQTTLKKGTTSTKTPLAKPSKRRSTRSTARKSDGSSGQKKRKVYIELSDGDADELDVEED
jgi:hypothetical protein